MYTYIYIYTVYAVCNIDIAYMYCCTWLLSCILPPPAGTHSKAPKRMLCPQHPLPGQPRMRKRRQAMTRVNGLMDDDEIKNGWAEVPSRICIRSLI